MTKEIKNNSRKAKNKYNTGMKRKKRENDEIKRDFIDLNFLRAR